MGRRFESFYYFSCFLYIFFVNLEPDSSHSIGIERKNPDGGLIEKPVPDFFLIEEKL